MTKTPHLHQRPNSQYWHVRLMVPVAARAAIGRREFTKSLGVTDKRRAADLSHAVLAEWKATISAALGSSMTAHASNALRIPNTTELEQAALEVGFERAKQRATKLIEAKAKLGSVAFDKLPTMFEQRHRRTVRERAAGDLNYWIERARKLLQARGWALDETDPAFAVLVENLAAGGADTFAFAKALTEGTEHSFTPSAFVQSAMARRASRAAAGESVMELFERYASQRLAERRKRLDTINQDRKVVQLFDGYVGVGRSLASIDSKEVREWRNAVAALPPAFRKRKENAGLSLVEASALAANNGSAGISATTVNKYLSTISPLFDWARQEGYVDKNPCDGLFYDLQKGKKSGKGRRPPFSVAQLNRLLSSPLFTGFAHDGKEWMAGNERADDWRYWIPLICLFTGARIGEIAQLHVHDILEQDGINYFWIKNDDETGQTTKSGHSRPAVIHSKLREIGFLDFVERQRARSAQDRNTRLFAGLKPNGRGQISWTPSRFWRTYLTRVGLKNGGDGYGSHSFRHGLADQLRLAGYLDDEIEVALGHNQVTVTGGYGQVRQGTVARLSTMIEAVTFAGVDFAPLLTARSGNTGLL